MKENKGITLIALVVTIIVLLILAGVSISLIAGGDGIMGKAQNSIIQHNIAEAKESVGLKVGEYQTDYYQAVYIDKTTPAGTAQGDWIAQMHGKKTIQTGDYEFEITENDAPCQIKILKNKKLRSQITGTLLETGKIIWDEIKDGENTGEDEQEPDEPSPDEPTPGEPQEPATQYTVTFKANDGEGTVPEVAGYEPGDEVVIDFSKKPTRTGYNFVGWALTADATTALYTDGGTSTFIMGTSDVILYAVWETAEQYTLSYDATGGSGAPGSVTQFDKNFKISTAVPTKEGYNFKGWNTKQDGTGTTYSAGANITIEESTTLYAIWELSAGLIAWYDGINNTGNGHDYDATTWKDLTGRNARRSYSKWRNLDTKWSAF